MRSDEAASVKRQANVTWKIAGGGPRSQKAVQPRLEGLLLRMWNGELGRGAQRHAVRMYGELANAGELALEPPRGDAPDAAPLVVASPADRSAGSEAEATVAGRTQSIADIDAVFKRGISDPAGDADDLLTSHAVFTSLPQPVRSHCNLVAKSIILESKRDRKSVV